MIYYSSSQAPKFAEVSEALNQLKRNEAPTLPDHIERARCPNCDRLLPEKDGICPACISKWSTLKRIGAYLNPYRSRAVIDPRGVLAEFGTVLDDDVEVKVWDSTSEVRFLVLPERPEGTEGWTMEQLIPLVSRNSMIGVEKARPATEATA